MERELPTVKICDTEFIVDIHNKEFREVERPSNIIPFSKAYNYPDAVIINYDKGTRNVYEGNWVSFLQAGNTESVHLPPYIELDRIGVMNSLSTTELYDYAEQLTKRDKQNGEQSSSRLLPKIDVDGTEFFMDMRLGEFRKVDNPHHRISHSELFVLEGNKIGMIYDPLTQKAFSGTRQQYEQRSDLRLLEIPSLLMMNEDKTGKTFPVTSRPDKTVSEKEFIQQQQTLPRRKSRGL